MCTADEIGKYTDPMYMDSENFMPDSVKFQVVAAKEKELKNSLELFQKLNTIKPVLDSHAIQGIFPFSKFDICTLNYFYLLTKGTSQLEGQLHSIVFNQGVQERKVTSMTEETYSLLKDYSELVCSKDFKIQLLILLKNNLQFW